MFRNFLSFKFCALWLNITQRYNKYIYYATLNKKKGLKLINPSLQKDKLNRTIQI